MSKKLVNGLTMNLRTGELTNSQDYIDDSPAETPTAPVESLSTDDIVGLRALIAYARARGWIP
jgi:hypothetical protein